MTNVQYDNMTAYKAVDIDKSNSVHTIRINCQEEVEGIVMCSVDTNVFGYECISGQVTYSGKINVKLVYRDIEGQILSSNSNADYSDTIVDGRITPNSKMSFAVVVVDNKTDIAGNIVTVQLMLGMCATAYVASTCPMLLDSGELFTHYNHVEAVTDVDTINVNTDISCQLLATSDITRVIMADARVNCSDYVLLDGILTVSGDVVVSLMYLSQDTMVCDQLTSPYRSEVECPIVNGQLTVVPSVKSTRIRLDIVEGQMNNVFFADMTVSLCASSIVCTPVALIDDCYTSNSVLTLDRQQIVTTLPCGSVSARAVLEQNIASMDIGQLMTLTSVVGMVTNSRYLDGMVSVEGIVSGTIIHNKDGKVCGTVVELPFVENIDIDYISSACHGQAYVTVLSSSCNMVAGALVVRAELCIDILSHRDATYTVINGMTENMLDSSAKHGREVCMAKAGETLWQLAKAMHMGEDEILAINPDIVSPLENDTKIVIYNKL